MIGPLSLLNEAISGDVKHLPEYLLRTTLRFILAIIFSIIVSIAYATLAAKNARIGYILIPLLDILQSIPVCGYLSFTVTAFITLVPNNILGIELAVIFAVFTTQVWNMIFSVYQSLVSVPKEIYEVARICKMNKWQIFWKIELPFTIPGLVANITLSMYASWFFIVAQEVITVGTHNYTMPGMGAYISKALADMNFASIAYGFIAMIILIVIYNELLFKPLVSWSYKFRYEFTIGSNSKNYSWFLEYIKRSSIICFLIAPFKKLGHVFINLKCPFFVIKYIWVITLIFETLWWAFLLWSLFGVYQQVYGFFANHLTWNDFTQTIILGFLTASRITFGLFLASMIWVPIGIFIGLRPKISNRIQPLIQFMTSIPANLYWPLFVITILKFNLDPNFWLSLMLIIGPQWYILYNVIGGTQTIPTDILEAAKIYKLKYYHKLLKIILPSIFPFYLTGLITAAGGSWNASILSEIVSWGDTTLVASGLGSFITINTKDGNLPMVALGVMVMCIFVIIINQIIWKPLQEYASERFRLD